jgi:TonB C terminal
MATMQRKAPENYDVEVVSINDLWTKFGTPLPDMLDAQLPQPALTYRWRHWGTRIAAVLLTLVMHVALISSALVGTTGRPLIKPLNEGVSADGKKENTAEFVSVMLLLNDHSITPPDMLSNDLADAMSKESAPVTQESVLQSTIGTPKPPQTNGSDDSTDESSSTAEATGDGAGRAMLFGGYMGQIKARIERVWEHPISAIITRFQCQVQIKQNSRGEVLEVTLRRCDNDPAWQLSLVHAIQSASPLSAAPSNSVFTELITLNFEAQKTLQVNDEVAVTL